MKKEMNTKARIAAFGGGSASDTPKADSRAPMAPPSSNRGGTETEDAGAFQESFECYETYILDGKGNLLGVPLRRGVSDSAFIDQISFSFHEKTFFDKYGVRVSLLEDEDFIRAASMLSEEVFGFGIYKESKGSGGRFYERCWLMGSEYALYGRVHFGGQQNTILFELTGTGCGVAKEGWESRLFAFLTNAIRPKITRVDVAKDFFNGEYSPNQAREDRNKGLFTCHHVKPKGECLGSDWEEDDESKMTKGKTYGIGSRESSKYVRVYEKGKQLGALKLNSKQKTSLSLSKFYRIRANISAAHIRFANASLKRQRAYMRLKKTKSFQLTVILNGLRNSLDVRPTV